MHSALQSSAILVPSPAMTALLQWPARVQCLYRSHVTAVAPAAPVAARQEKDMPHVAPCSAASAQGPNKMQHQQTQQTNTQVLNKIQIQPHDTIWYHTHRFIQCSCKIKCYPIGKKRYQMISTYHLHTQGPVSCWKLVHSAGSIELPCQFSWPLVCGSKLEPEIRCAYHGISTYRGIRWQDSSPFFLFLCSARGLAFTHAKTSCSKSSFILAEVVQ